MMLTAFISCQTKTAVTHKKTVVSENLHQEAAEALEAHQFVIEAIEIHLPDAGKVAITSPGNYISLNGQQAVINFTRDVYPRDPWEHLVIRDDAAQMTKSTKKNGDLEYCIIVDGGRSWLKRKIFVTPYRDTNECFVQVQEYSGGKILNFKGQVFGLHTSPVDTGRD